MRVNQSMPTVLAIDTSTEIASVALLRDGVVLAENEAADTARHDHVLLPRIDAVLAAAGVALRDVNLLAVGLGPGGFGGLRVGLSTIKGLAIATGVGTVGVSSLAALARSAPAHATHVLPLIDAFRAEVYAALYERRDATLIEIMPAMVGEPSAALANVRNVSNTMPWLLGNGLNHRQALQTAWPELVIDDAAIVAVPRARDVAALALEQWTLRGADPLATLLPIYTRESDAKLPAKPLQVSSE